ncbi:hypothetical protein P3T76_013662 [Phytophthora citrophthora]|uniref:Uncharacterized protein n=1 Tax=Phytophthora citrophthora TaxID=4793 RepID=A0AAD9G2S7_9STRA|nr:hypothetical protein P3T76_013662 [Phytophthora citrophthora]
MRHYFREVTLSDSPLSSCPKRFCIFKMKRRTPRGRDESSLSTPSQAHRAHRKPEWNAYLTDDTQYKLNQQQQLQRALQQLSTAHFSARSPAASASRRRLKAGSTHSSMWSAPRSAEKNRQRSASRTRLADVQDTGELNTQRRLQFADVSMDLEEPTPRRRAGTANSVSFQVEDEDRMDPEHKAHLQGELEVLERMLWELETETERLSWQQTPQKMKMQQKKPPRVRTGVAMNLKQGNEVEVKVEEEAEPESQVEMFEENEVEPEEGYMLEGDARREGGEDANAEIRLGDVCYKSLEIGLELARKMDTLKKDFNNEHRLRADRELKIEMLEQEVRSTQAKCNYLEAKYQNMASQVDGMREAVIATEEAIQRMALAFEYSQRRRGKTSNPPTPNISKSLHSKDVLRASSKATTPQKSMENQENWTPNKGR